MSNTTRRVALIALLAFIGVFDFLSVRHNSLTYDEPMHFRYGAGILKGHSARFVDGTMPFTALNALPQLIANSEYSGVTRDTLGRVAAGRPVTILFALLLGYYLFKWTRELYGDLAGIFSLCIYAFSPTFIAHSGLITTDVYAAGMVTISTYYFWRFVNVGGWGRGALSALLLGISQLAKYSCLFLYPIFVLIVVVRYWSDLAAAVKAGARAQLGRYIVRFLKFAILFAVVSILVIDAGFLFNKPSTPLGQYKFRSESFKSMQSSLTALKSFRVPLAYPFLDGIDWGKYREETGKGFGSMYLFGKLRPVGGFKGYYFFAYLYKEPIAIHFLIVLALIFYVRNRRRYSFMRNELFLAIPVIVYGIYMNFLFKIQIGIRHYLVVFPFIYIFCGSLVSGWRGKERAEPWVLGRKMRVAIAMLLAYLVISVLSYFPHYIPYFNELVWDRRQAYKILADSNIDWGQGLNYANDYVAKHPGTFLEEGLWYMKNYREKHMEEYLHPQFPDSGIIVVNVNNYVGIYHPHRYRWLRERYKPIGQVAYSYLVFRISPEDSMRMRPAEEDSPVQDSLGVNDEAR
jgi:hypothetical protein